MFKKGSVSSLLRVLSLSLILMAISSGSVLAQTVILNQPPTQSGYILSYPGAHITVAENFNLSSTSTITQIRIWGCYPPTNLTGTDNFSVIFHADSGGLPGAVISAQNNVPVIRQLSGGPNILSTLIEYVYTLTLATPVTLAHGTYWIEIYNDLTGSIDGFAWEEGTFDPVNGIHGLAGDGTNVPGTTWSSNPGFDVAIEITASEAIPTINEWGMIIFIALAGLAAVYYLRRQRRSQS